MADTAAELLRASVAALPDQITRTWEVTQSRIVRERESGWHVAMPSGWRGVQAEQAIAAHIALTGSPDVTTALADLLDALAGDWHDEDEVTAARDALEQAIIRSRGHG